MRLLWNRRGSGPVPKVRFPPYSAIWCCAHEPPLWINGPSPLNGSHGHKTDARFFRKTGYRISIIAPLARIDSDSSDRAGSVICITPAGPMIEVSSS
jgi:hypothetical protein